MHVGAGDAKKVWHLPEKLLKSKSTFFTAALEGGFAEGISKTVTLPEEDPDLFENFVEWLYVGFNQSAEWDGDTLIDQWTLGDRLGCALMQDDAMCKLIKYYVDYHPVLDTLERVYEVSTPESKLRRFVIDQCLYDIRHSCPKMEVECTYLQFLKQNEDFAKQLGEATILLANEEPKDPSRDQNPYLCGPSPCTPKPSAPNAWSQLAEINRILDSGRESSE